MVSTIKFPLQIYMQHLHFQYPHTWTIPEKTVAMEFSLKHAYNKHSKKHFVIYLISNIARGSKSNITKGASGAIQNSKPYLGGVLSLTRIVYAVLKEDKVPEPWVKLQEEYVGTRTVQRSRPSRSDKSRTSKSERKQKQETQSDTHKVQSKAVATTIEEEVPGEAPEKLEAALKLHKSKEAGTSQVEDVLVDARKF